MTTQTAGEGSEDAFVLNFAPTGMVPRRSDTPHVPLHPDEIAREVQEAVALGITLVHLHAREADESPSNDASIYADIIRRIRSFAPELVICLSLSGRNRPEFEARSAPLALDGELKPDMASLTLSSLNFSRQASLNAPEMIRRLAEEMLLRGIVPELEAFDGGMINYARYLMERKLVEAPCYFNLIMGNPANAQCDPLSLGAMLAKLPHPCLWSTGGIGRTQTAAAMLGLAAGGGVRMGLEDNLHFDTARTRLASNRELLQRTHEMAAQLERPLMTSAEFRRRMGLLPGNGTYGRQAKTAGPTP
jgi:uncharacterized protein (DUF849 family)